MSNSSKSQTGKAGGGSRLQSQTQSQPLSSSKRSTSSLDASDKNASERLDPNKARKISKSFRTRGNLKKTDQELISFQTQPDSDEDVKKCDSLDSNADNSECSDVEIIVKPRRELDERDLKILELEKSNDGLRKQLASTTSAKISVETPVSGKSYSNVSSTSSTKSKKIPKNQNTKIYIGSRNEKLTMKDVKINEVNAQKLLEQPHYNGLSFIIPFTCVAKIEGQLMDVDLNQQAFLYVVTMLTIKSVQYKAGLRGCMDEAGIKLCNPRGFPEFEGLVMPPEITNAFRKNTVFKDYAKKVIENVMQRNKCKIN